MHQTSKGSPWSLQRVSCIKCHIAVVPCCRQCQALPTLAQRLLGVMTMDTYASGLYLVVASTTVEASCPQALNHMARHGFCQAELMRVCAEASEAAVQHVADQLTSDGAAQRVPGADAWTLVAPEHASAFQSQVLMAQAGSATQHKVACRACLCFKAGLCHDVLQPLAWPCADLIVCIHQTAEFVFAQPGCNITHAANAQGNAAVLLLPWLNHEGVARSDLYQSLSRRAISAVIRSPGQLLHSKCLMHPCKYLCQAVVSACIKIA